MSGRAGRAEPVAVGSATAQPGWHWAEWGCEFVPGLRIEQPGGQVGAGPLGPAAPEGDEVVFRVEGNRAVLAWTPDFFELAGTIRVPAAKRNVAWDEVIRRTRAERLAMRSPPRCGRL